MAVYLDVSLHASFLWLIFIQVYPCVCNSFFNQGYHGDTSKTFLCGDVDESLVQLVKVTEECLEKGISVCRDGASFNEIGKIIR